MLEIALPIGLLALLIAIPAITRSTAVGAALVAAGFGVSGALLQFVGVRGTDFDLRSVQIWLTVTLLVLLAVAFWLRAQSPERSMPLRWWPWALAAASAVAFAVSRALAPLDPAPLSSVGYLITRVSAEDNAKWVDASARLVSDMPLDTWANVGGPLVLLLTLAASILGGASQVLYGGINQVALSAGSPILAEYLLVIASPFALTPLIGKAISIRDTKRRLPWYLFALGALVLWAAVTVLLSVGHITLQYTLLVLTLWVATFLVPRPFVRFLASAAVATLAMVWFPLGPVSLTVIAVALVVGVRAVTRPRSRAAGIAVLATFGVIAVLLFEFLRSSISYSLGLNAQSVPTSGGGGPGSVTALSFPSLPLFSDRGGTEEVTLTLLALTVVGVIGVLYASATPNVSIRRQVVRFAPMVLLAGFASSVAVLDFWAVGDGPGYGALKVAFACLIPILVATLPIALLAFTPSHRGGVVLAAGLVAVVVVVLSLDTLLPRAAMQLKSSLWPSTADGPYWGPAEVRATADQPLSANPIGCVYLPPGAEYPSALPWGQTAYSCTRLLSGVAGLGSGAAVLTDWQLTEWLQDRSLWDSYHGYLSMLPPDVQARTVILMDEEKNVVGIDTIAYLLQRYPPSAEGS